MARRLIKATYYSPYYQGGDIEDEIEDALREQTRLYDQRIQLIDQMSQATGLVYNYQGDV